MTRLLRLLAVVAAVCASLIGAASAQARLPRDFVGITSEDVFARGSSYREANLSAQHALKIGLIRQTFDWAQIETSPGVYRLGRYDSFVLAAARHGITVLPILFNGPRFHSLPHFERGASRPDKAAFGQFAATIARRYGRNGSLWAAHPEVPARPIRSYQIWNEPNLRIYWLPRPSARQYVGLLKAARRAIKGVDRRAEIVTAGIPPSKLSMAVRIMRYLKSMYKVRGAKKAFDTLAINSYAKNLGELKKLLKSVRKLMRRRHDRAKIWITEMGWATGGPPSRFNVGVAQQARLIKSSIRFIRRSRGKLRLRGFVYFSWRDSSPYPPLLQDLWGLHTGLLTQAGAPKRGYAAFRSAVR